MGTHFSTTTTLERCESTTCKLSGTEDRAVGCLVGLAVGDAFGVTQERFPYGTFADTLAMVKRQRQEMQDKGVQVHMEGGGPFAPLLILQPGEWTDDTAQALCVADSLLSCGKLDQQDLMDKFVAWWDHGYNACRYEKGKDGKLQGMSLGLGATVKNALRKFQESGRQEVAVQGLDPEKHAGNGCIMRLAPVAIYWHHRAREAVCAARSQSQTTHNLPECMDACALMAHLLVKAIQGTKKDTLLSPATLQAAADYLLPPYLLSSNPAKFSLSSASSTPTKEATTSSLFAPDLPSNPSGSCDTASPNPCHNAWSECCNDLQVMGWAHNGIAELVRTDASWRRKSEEEIITLPGRALWTLEAALWVINRTSSFREAIILATCLGGDADTVAAVVGQLAGALYGESGIPLKWRTTLHHYPKIRERALRLVRQEPFSKELVLP